MDTNEIKRLIEQGISAATVQVEGDGTHFQALVISSQFTGKLPLQRHRMVYATLGSLVGKEIHALSIQAHTPEEWEQQQAFGVIK